MQEQDTKTDIIQMFIFHTGQEVIGRVTEENGEIVVKSARWVSWQQTPQGLMLHLNPHPTGLDLIVVHDYIYRVPQLPKNLLNAYMQAVSGIQIARELPGRK